MHVFDHANDLSSVSKNDRLVDIVHSFVTQCEETVKRANKQNQLLAAQVQELRAEAMRHAELSADAARRAALPEEQARNQPAPADLEKALAEERARGLEQLARERGEAQEDLVAERSRLSAALEHLRAKWETQLQQATAKAQEELAQERARAQEMAAVVEKLKKERQLARQKIEQLVAEKTALLEQNMSDHQQVEQYVSIFSAAFASHHGPRVRSANARGMSELESSNQRLALQLQALEERLAGAQAAEHNLRTETEQLRSELSEVRTARQAAPAERQPQAFFSALLGDAAATAPAAAPSAGVSEAELASVRAERDTWMGRCTDAEDRARQQQQKAEVLQQRLAESGQQYEDAQAMLAELQRACAQAREENGKLLKRLDGLQAAHDDLLQANQELARCADSAR